MQDQTNSPLFIRVQKMMFVHVPRTAGTSIINSIPTEVGNRAPILLRHDPYFILEEMNPNIREFFVFAVVRNPYTRAYSHYKAFSKNVVKAGVKFNEITFFDFLTYVRSKGNSIYSNVTFNRAPYAIFDQCFYIHNNVGELTLNKLYRFENLSELANDLNIDLLNINKSNTSEEEYLNAYTKNTINLVKHLYYRDFEILGYSSNFDDSILK